MNIINTVQNGISARLFAGITIVSLLLSAFPVAFFVANAAVQNVTIGVSAVPNPGSGGQETIILSNSGSAQITIEQLQITDRAGNTLRAAADQIVPATGSVLLNVTDLNNDEDDIIMTGTNVIGSPATAVTYSGDPAVGSTVSGSFDIAIEDGTPGPVVNADTGETFATVQEAIDDIDTNAGDTIYMNADETITSQITIDKEVTLFGDGYSIIPTFTKTGTDNNAAIGIINTADVKVFGVVIEGTGGTDLHGVNVFNSTGVELLELEIFDNDFSAVNIAGSEVVIEDIETAENGTGNNYHVINGAKGSPTDQEATLEVGGTSIHGEDSALKVHVMMSTNATPNFTDTETQYDNVTAGVNAFLASLPAPALPANTQAYNLKAPVVPQKFATVSATKIVCEYESELPNWGTDGVGPSSITGTTAADWLAVRKMEDPLTSCREVPTWEFQWAPNGTPIAGNYNTVTGPDANWNTFSGTASVLLTKNTNNNNNQPIVFREVLETGYVQFGQANGFGVAKDIGAEFYCGNDVVGYDNLERINNPVEGETYHCVGFNAEELGEPGPRVGVSTSKIVCDYEGELPNWGAIDEGPAQITDVTAAAWLADNLAANPNTTCRAVENWEFEWASTEFRDTLTNYNSHVGSMGSDWNIFSDFTVVSVDELANNQVLMREVLQDDYVKFGRNNPVSAEFYCDTDVVGYDNLEVVQGVTADEIYHCVGFNALGLGDLPQLTSEVTMCKYDESDNGLSGWQLALLGDEINTLAVQPDGTTQSMTNVIAGDYVLKASGTYEYRGSTGLLADARFSERQSGDPDFGAYNFQPWAESGEPTGYTPGGLAVQVNNDLGALWGSVFSPTHTYYGSYTQAVDGNIDFYVFDSAYTDNVGSIDVSLHGGFTGLTGTDGCVTFTDVPHGTYQVEELMQGEYRNVSGLTAVTVDEETEQFEVVNTNVQLPEVATCSYISDIVLNDSPSQSNVASNVTNFTLNDLMYTTDDEFDLFVAGDINADAPYQDEAVVERTPDGLEVYFYGTGVNGGPVKEFSGSFKLNGVDLSGATISAGNEPVETNGVWQDVFTLDQSTGVVTFTLYTNSGNDSFVISGLTQLCDVPAIATLAITSPATEFEQLSGVHSFTADYMDDDEVVDLIQWAIRPGVCETSSVNLAGNVGGLSDVSSFVEEVFTADVDMTTWDNGEYCFIVNPREQSGEENLRETQTFVLSNPRAPESDMFRLTGTKYEVTESGTTTYAGWTISLVGTDRSTTTDANGDYYFDVEAGDWEVSEAVVEGWTQLRVERNGGVQKTDGGVATCSFSPGEEGEISEEISAQRVSSDSYACDFYNQQDEVVVEPEPESAGGTSSGGRSNRSLQTVAPAGLVLGASTDTCPFLVDFLQMGTDNDQVEVMKLQMFLNIFRSLYGGTENPITGNFGIITDTNVKKFQEAYKAEILEPWFNQGIVGHTKPTGFVYKTTLWKINDIVCPDTAVLPDFTGETLQSNVDLNAVAVQD